MTTNATTKDLLVLVADNDARFAINALLVRHQSLGIKQLTFDCYKHPNRDAGCFTNAPEFLRSFSTQYAHVLVIFDKEGSGQENTEDSIIEDNLKTRLEQNGWSNKAEVIAIAPELEIWVWSDSPNVEAVLGWTGKNPSLRAWLQTRNFLSSSSEAKPIRPKEAFEAAIKEARKPKSASIFAELASSVSFTRCTDRSFNKLKTTLSLWFALQGCGQTS